MPSVTSSSVDIVLLSSTVMTPSLPTRSNASPIRSPTSASWAETVATPAMAARPSTGVAALSRAACTASTAARMPRPSAVGLAPAATLRIPWCTRAWASTVAVVVPSPATSLVLVATLLASCAPRFSYGLASSTSRAIVTPSLVIVGAPNFLSRTTLRPRGPRVTFTVSASLSTPRSRERRASSLNLMILAMGPFRSGGAGRRRPPRNPSDRVARGGRGRGGTRDAEESLLHDGEQVAGREHEVLLAAVDDLGAAVLRVDDHVADVDVERHTLAVVVDAAGAHGDDRALLRLLLGGVRDDQAGGGGGLGLVGLDHDAVLQRLDGDLGSGRHVGDAPFGVGRMVGSDAVAGGRARRRGDQAPARVVGTLPTRVPAAQQGPAGGWTTVRPVRRRGWRGAGRSAPRRRRRCAALAPGAGRRGRGGARGATAGRGGGSAPRARAPAGRVRGGARRARLGAGQAAHPRPAGVRRGRRRPVPDRRHPRAGRPAAAGRPPGPPAAGRRGRFGSRPGLCGGHRRHRSGPGGGQRARGRPRSARPRVDRRQRRRPRPGRSGVGRRRRRRGAGGNRPRRGGGRVRRRNARPGPPGGGPAAAPPRPLVAAVADGRGAAGPRAAQRRQGGAGARSRPRSRGRRGRVGLRRRVDRRGAAVGPRDLRDLAPGGPRARRRRPGADRRRGPRPRPRRAGGRLFARAGPGRDPLRPRVARRRRPRRHARRSHDRLPDLRRSRREPLGQLLPGRRRAAVQPQEAARTAAGPRRGSGDGEEAGGRGRGPGAQAGAARTRHRHRDRRRHPGCRRTHRPGVRRQRLKKDPALLTPRTPGGSLWTGPPQSSVSDSPSRWGVSCRRRGPGPTGRRRRPPAASPGPPPSPRCRCTAAGWAPAARSRRPRSAPRPTPAAASWPPPRRPAPGGRRRGPCRPAPPSRSGRRPPPPGTTRRRRRPAPARRLAAAPPPTARRRSSGRRTRSRKARPAGR